MYARPWSIPIVHPSTPVAVCNLRTVMTMVLPESGRRHPTERARHAEVSTSRRPTCPEHTMNGPCALDDRHAVSYLAIRSTSPPVAPVTRTDESEEPFIRPARPVPGSHGSTDLPPHRAAAPP